MMNFRHLLVLAAFFAAVFTHYVQAGTIGPLTYTLNGESVTIDLCDPSTVGAVDIPSTIEGKPVREIALFSFAGCTSVTSVTIPENVETIETLAFYECASLTNVIIPSTVSSIGDGVFYLCGSLQISPWIMETRIIQVLMVCF